MSADADAEMLEAVGLWECGDCGAIVDTTHYYQDRMTGLTRHEANAERRAALAEQCGWQFDDDYGTVVRCSRPVARIGQHQHASAGPHPIRWDSRPGDGAIPPYDPASANTAGPESGDSGGVA